MYVASIAKQFTAAAIAALAIDGALSLGDSVRRWLPELSVAWETVTLDHLLAQTGGLVESNPVDTAHGSGIDGDFSTWDRVAIIATTAPECRSGTVHRYSNHGYVLLAAVVERVTGETLGNVARGLLFAPAAMTDSRFVDTRGATAVPGWIGGRQRVDIGFSSFRGDIHHRAGRHRPVRRDGVRSPRPRPRRLGTRHPTRPQQAGMD